MGWGKYTAATVLACALASPGFINSAVPADANLPIDQGQQSLRNVSTARVRVPLHKSEIVPLGKSFNDVLVGSTDIIDVVPLNNHQIYVLGKRLGTTNISILDHDKRLVSLIDVEVGLDTGEIAAKIQAAVGPSAIRVSTQDNKIVLSGTAMDAKSLDRAVAIAADLAPQGGGVINLVQIAAPQQVMLKVRILEASRNAGRELGFRWDVITGGGAVRIGRGVGIGTNGGTSSAISDIIGAGTVAASSALTGTPQFGLALSRLVNNGSVNIDVLINALESKGLVRRLAEPNLVALSGEVAEFLAGGQFPFPVAAALGQPPSIQFKDFGVRLAFTPTVLGNGLINLRLDPEVSDIDPTITDKQTGTPGLQTRRARTTIELRDGQSFAMAGLLQSFNQRELEQLPWLGSVPVLGTLFRSTAFQQRETELVVIVTPSLVIPRKPGAPLASPLDTTVAANDPDLFLLGKPEREKARPVAVEEHGTAQAVVAGPYGHILPQPVSPSPPR